ncbi:MAG: hypothetical protein ACYTGB_05935 [Planctomycetota bacterium]|jgi:hypothetical protein
MRPAIRLLTLLAVLCAQLGPGLAPGSGHAGENAEKPEEPLKVKPRSTAQLHKRQIDALEREVARYSTVAVVEVTAAGALEDDENRPELPNEHHFQFRVQQAGQKVQQVLCKVVEVLRGPAEAKQMEVLFRHFDYREVQRRVMEAGGRGRATPEEILKHLGAAAGEKYLVMLAVDPNAAPEDGGKGPVYSTLRAPLFGPPAPAVKAVRGMMQRIRTYREPPRASEKQLAAAAAHIKALESAEFGVRKKAHEALVKLGPSVRDLVGRWRRESPDLEVRLRCEKILDDIKPIPGGHPDDWAGKWAIKKIEAAEEKGDEDDEDGEEKDGEKAAPAVLPAGPS